MSDITFMKGYGFPRGSKMDYAGYNGLLVNNRRFRAGPSIPYAPEPGIFSKIPALDGMDEFGSEYTFAAEPPPITCPPGQRCSELEFEDDVITAQAPYGPEYRPDLLGGSGKGALGIGLGLLALYLLTR